MSFKQTASHFEISGDARGTVEEVDDGPTHLHYDARRVRLVFGRKSFTFQIVDRCNVTVYGPEHKLLAAYNEDRVRFTSEPHGYYDKADREDVNLAREMAQWIAADDLRGQGAERAAWTIFYTLEIRPALKAGSEDHWMAKWCPEWWGMLVKMFGPMERAA